MALEFRKIEYHSKEYQQSLELRERILRIPLGLRLTPQELMKDADDIHLGGFLGEQLVACLILSKVAPQRMKMRQVAVDENLQGKGVGTQLVRFSEQVARECQITSFELSARSTAVEFYLRQGYEVIGEPYSEQKIQHIKMTKSL